MSQEYATLRDFIIEQSLKYKQNIAFQYYNKGKELVSISYFELLRDIQALGTFLLSRGYRNQHIAIISENSYDWIRLFFAISFSGNVCVPIARDLGEDVVLENLKNSDSKCFFYSVKSKRVISSILEKEAENFTETFSMEDLSEYVDEGLKRIQDGDTSFMDMNVDSNDVAAIFFTSGTTGSQKCVMLTQKSLSFNIQRGARRLDSAVHRKTLLIILPLTHVLSFIIMCDIFHFGSRGFISKGIKSFFNDMAEIQPDIIGVVPLFPETIYKEVFNELEAEGKISAYSRLCKFSRALLRLGIDLRSVFFKKIRQKLGGNLKLMISGGAHLSQTIIDEFQNWGIDVITGYGITECSPIIAASEYEDSIPGSVGKPLDGVEVIINDPDEKGIGEICVKGPTLMKGYYNNPSDTEKAFGGGMFHTGDLGYLDEDGYLFITGRIKNLIILSNGENVSPELIESKLMESTIVKETVAYQRENVIVAEIYPNRSYIEKNGIIDIKESVDQAVKETNKKLPVYARIGDVVLRDNEFPKNASKKIVRNKEQ